MSQVSPIAYIRAADVATPSKVADVVARTACTRLVACAYLEATHGDVQAACECWRNDHQHWGERVAYERLSRPLEASE